MLMLDDLSPDGVRIVVNWDKMVIGASIFVPCINTQKAKEQVVKLCKGRRWQATIKIVIENDKLGIRIWRTI
jgi:hypothetical protein